MSLPYRGPLPRRVLCTDTKILSREHLFGTQWKGAVLQWHLFEVVHWLHSDPNTKIVFLIFSPTTTVVSFSLPYSIFCVSQIALFYMDFGTVCTVIMTPRPLSFIFFCMFMMSFEIERRKVFM